MATLTAPRHPVPRHKSSCRIKREAGRTSTPLIPMAGGIFASHFFQNTSGGEGTDGMGGAIFTRGIMTVVDSSFVDNSSDAASGGAIGHNAGSSNRLTIANVTFSGNEAFTSGGAIANLHTVTGNTCGSTLQSESGCLIEVTATPGFDGPNTGTLTATAAGGLLDEIGLVVTGFTPSPSLTLTPADGLDFGSISTAAPSATKLATVHNDSNVDLTGLTRTTGLRRGLAASHGPAGASSAS